MNSFKLTLDIPGSIDKIAHGQQILFLGSCFSDEMASKAKYHGLKVDSNPFGTVFHPSSLSKFIKETLENTFNLERIINRNDLYFSWDANSTNFAYSKTELFDQLKIIRQNWKQKLQTAEFIFITFGTAWGYHLQETGELVANCHKFPSDIFSKKLSDSSLLFEEWKEVIEILRKNNPQLKIVITVSPVRHSKDGLIENNRSKAILIDLVRRLETEVNCLYFPSYEIVMDELRDYRFFKLDRVHPNKEAIDYVWTRFSEVYFTNETISLNREIEKLRLAEAHRSLFPNSEESKLHILKTAEKREKLLANFPMICLD